MANVVEPVDWQNDPAHRAKKIKCAVCSQCEWQNSGYCLYGGPFDGYYYEGILNENASSTRVADAVIDTDGRVHQQN